MGYYFSALKKYFIFKGRTTRKEFWMFYLIHSCILIIMIVLSGEEGDIQNSFMIMLVGFYYLATIIPLYAAAIRRVHDTNNSGWWFFVPIINILLLFKKTYPKTNRYGAITEK